MSGLHLNICPNWRYFHPHSLTMQRGPFLCHVRRGFHLAAGTVASGRWKHNWKRRDDVTLAMCFSKSSLNLRRWRKQTQLLTLSIATSCDWPAWCWDDGILRDNYSLQWLLCAEGRAIIEDAGWKCSISHWTTARCFYTWFETSLGPLLEIQMRFVFQRYQMRFKPHPEIPMPSSFRKKFWKKKTDVPLFQLFQPNQTKKNKQTRTIFPWQSFLLAIFFGPFFWLKNPIQKICQATEVEKEQVGRVLHGWLLVWCLPLFVTWQVRYLDEAPMFFV